MHSHAGAKAWHKLGKEANTCGTRGMRRTVQVADARGADLLVLAADAVHNKSVDANLLVVSIRVR